MRSGVIFAVHASANKHIPQPKESNDVQHHVMVNAFVTSSALGKSCRPHPDETTHARTKRQIERMVQDCRSFRAAGVEVDVEEVYVRTTAMEMSDDRTRAAFACCMPPSVASPRPTRGWPDPAVAAVRADAVIAFNSSTGSLAELRSSSGRPLTVTRRGTVYAPLPDLDSPADRLVVTKYVEPSEAGRGGRWTRCGAHAVESLLADEGDGDTNRGGDLALEAAAMALREALARADGDDARLAALEDAAERGRTAGLEPCEYVGCFDGEEAAVKALCVLSRYAGGEQVARGLRAMCSDRARIAALRAMPPAVARRVDGPSLLRSFATDDRRLDALAFAADRDSEVMTPALLSCFDGDGRRADALRSLPAAAVTDYNLRAVVTRFEDRPGGHRLPVFARLALERPGLCSDWAAACDACFPPNSGRRRAAAKVARRASLAASSGG